MPETVQKRFDIKFYSRFESGNLQKAIKVTVKPEFTFSGIVLTSGNLVKAEFDLYLEPDTMTDSLMHWYYF